MFVNKMNGIKAILLLLLSLISMNAHSIGKKPLISLYVFGENKINQSIKISVQSILNQSGFVIKRKKKRTNKLPR